MRSILFSVMLVLAATIAVPLEAAIADGVAAASVQAEPTSAAGVAESQVAQSSSPVQAAPARSMRAYWHVFIAFGITWALIFGFAVSIGRRFEQLEVEVHRMGGSR